MSKNTTIQNCEFSQTSKTKGCKIQCYTTYILHYMTNNIKLSGLSAHHTKQLIQNAAVRIIFDLFAINHVTPLLCSLYWLLVTAYIKFNVIFDVSHKARNCTQSEFGSKTSNIILPINVNYFVPVCSSKSWHQHLCGEWISK